MGANNPQLAPVSRLLLNQIETLVERHDKFLIMNNLSIIEFCEDPKKGLVLILIALDDNADAIGFDGDDKRIINEMLQIVPDKVKELKNLSLTSTQRDNIEKETKDIIRKFIRKPCKTLLNK